MTDHFNEVVITSAVRTPVGIFLGSLSTLPAPKLGAIAIEAAVKRSELDKNEVDEVIMGCVLPAGIGQAPARQACIYAGLPHKVECLTINKVCGSGLKAVMLAAQAIMVGDAEVIVAGGMENMSLAPYLLPRARTGYRMGNDTIIDGMIFDGLWDPYNNFHMGNAAEICAREKGITREMQDQFAIASSKKALAAQEKGEFKDEIVAVTIPQKKGDPIVVDMDEGLKNIRLDKVTKLNPAFDKNGTVTAANASSINDGAAAVVVMSAEKARKLGIKPLVRILGQASFAQAPEWFTTAPIGAIEKVLKKCHLTPADIDFYEVNEAFSVVSLAVEKGIGYDPARVNVKGGAVVLGHPIGGSGARIFVTLVHTMLQRQGQRGLASLCIGGGEGAALVVELC